MQAGEMREMATANVLFLIEKHKKRDNDWLATILASVALWIYSLEPEERGHRSKAEQGIEDERE